ncbi:MAG TPA: response regulator transcription factor [Patescibacteria group bacterium]|nr:response regulator transcription factor [Patescibacteria group bacterium]
MRILLVEDDESIVTVYKTALQLQGWEIDIASDGKTGLTKALHAPYPDVLILDLMLPVMNGFDVLKVVKETETTKHIPVIVLTSLSESETQEALSLGAALCLVKTECSPDELVGHIKTLTEKK